MAGEACCSCEVVEEIVKKHVEALIDALEQFTAATPAEKPKKAKRKMSGYNLFIKECTTGGASDMKACAANYRTITPEEKEQYKERAKSAS